MSNSLGPYWTGWMDWTAADAAQLDGHAKARPYKRSKG